MTKIDEDDTYYYLGGQLFGYQKKTYEEILRNNEKSLNHSPEQVVRILDALREGENLVRMGLSEKTNFEVTLFRAVEAGRTKSIDHVIRKITNLIPEDIKKKTDLESNQSRFTETKTPVGSEKTSKTNQVFSKEELVNEKKYETKPID